MDTASSWMLNFSDPVGVVRFLAELGSRPEAIMRLTDAPRSFVKAMQEDVDPARIDRGGRRPRSIGSLMETTERHVFASVFLRAYIHHSTLGAGRGARGILNKQAVVRALWSMHASVKAQSLDHLGDDCDLTIDHALLIAEAYEVGEVDITQHSHCKSHFLTSRKLEIVRGAQTYGECPICRGVCGVGKTKQPSKVPSKSKLAEQWGDLSVDRSQRLGKIPPGVPASLTFGIPLPPPAPVTPPLEAVL